MHHGDSFRRLFARVDSLFKRATIGSLVFCLVTATVLATELPTGGAPAAPSHDNQVSAALAGCQSYYVDLLSPTQGATFTAPATITLRADAYGLDDGCLYVNQVNFYNGTTLLAQVSRGSDGLFSHTWSGVPAGSYTIQAITGNGKASASANITVSQNKAPSVTMGTPTGAPFIAAATIGLSASASDTDGSISKVEFYRGTTLIGTDTVAPFTASYTAASAGTYSFTAKATDNAGAATTSAPTSVTVAANSLPTVSITSPANGASFTAPATVPITATASDTDGSIVRVEFRINGTLLSSDTTAPHQASWSTGTVGGSYAISATAVDNKGGSRTAGINVTLNPPTGSLSANPGTCTIYSGDTCQTTISWTSTDPAAEVWRHYDYDYQTQEGVDELHKETLIGSGASGSRAFEVGGSKRNQYFELKSGATVIATVFPSSNYAPWSNITAPSDGKVFNRPTNIVINANGSDQDGSVAKVEFYRDGILLGNDTTSPYGITWNDVPSGTYALTTRVYDNRGAMRQSVPITVVANTTPAVSLTAPAANSVVSAPANVVIRANASDADDSIAMVELYAGATKLATYTTVPYELQWNNVPSGTYSITAKAYDTRGGVTTSAVSTLVVDNPPGVALTAPTAGTIINGPGSFTLTANASDSDGSISSVEFYRGSILIGSDTTAPYTSLWSNIAPGTYSITAKAIDNHGLSKSSSPVTFVVNAVPLVSITAPAMNTVVLAHANVLVQASATDPDDSVAMVEFYVNGEIRATDYAAPFTLQANNMPAGVYSLTAKAFDTRGGATMSAPTTLIVNEPPQVQLVSPANNTGILVSKSIVLAATAGDIDGTISKVDFYAGTSLVGTATTTPYQVSWSAASAGDFSLTAKAYDNRGASTTSAPVLLRVRSSPFELVLDATPVSLSGELPTHDPKVGRVAGQAGVRGGAASYSIPIVVPPGRRGMQPELALTYNSSAGNGVAGMGWSLSGLSSIERCPATLDQDGTIRPVNLDAADKLCMDGQRLIATSGVYGQSGTTYATEIDSFARVTQLGGALNSASAYFKVQTKSGDIVYYGGNSTGASTSRVIPGGVSVPMTWLIERRQDSVGNMIRYAYTSYGNGEVLLSYVLYTGFAGTDGDRRVDLVYQTRTGGVGANDQASSYVAGGLIRQTQRLVSVTTRAGSQPVREYQLAYQLSNTSWRSLLTSITECAYAGASRYCRPATQFAWQQRSPTYVFKPLALETAAAVLDRRQISSMKQGGDFNGDGTVDYIIRQGAAGMYVVSLAPDRKVKSAMALPDGALADYYRNVDFDLDGRADVLSRDSSNNLVVSFWHGPMDATDAATAFNETWNTGINVPISGSTSAEVKYVGDMDGDGRADILVHRNLASPTAACYKKLEVYRNVPAPAGGKTPSTFSLAVDYCLKQTGTVGSIATYESLDHVRDFDGDGLMDLLINTRPPTIELESNPSRVAYGRKGATLYYSDQAYSSLFPATDPIQPAEAKGSTYSMWVDLNGDGLDDLLWAKAGWGGSWTARFNTGKGFSGRITFATNVGIEHCIGEEEAGECEKNGFAPWHAAQITTADIDNDGRTEILIPRRFARQSCVPVYADPAVCPEPGGTGTCQEVRYMCSENPLTGTTGLGGGLITFSDGEMARAYGLHQNGYTRFDRSEYVMDALRVVETGAGTWSLIQVPTTIVGGGGRPGEDIYGDGMQDVMVMPLCTATSTCARPVADSSGEPYPSSQVPATYPGGYSFAGSAIFINENQGASASRNPDGLTPQIPDMLAMVTDGLGVQTAWTYYPLGSSAGRTAGETPLYSVPAGTSGRYVDDRHFYFTSSMPVVAEMIQSDGVGDYRSWRYGYSEAMYHARGRGFQGFRSIVEEDEASGTRTTTTFHQKFPLTSQPEQILVNSLKRAGTSAPISKQSFTWRCNRGNRSDTTACLPSNGLATVRFPYLDATQTWTYDAAIADNPSAGTPPLLTYRQSVAADDSTCTGSFSSTSGYDAYGNLTASTDLIYDGSGTGGYRSFVDVHCTRTRTSYATADTANWWLDKVNSRTVTTQVAYDAGNHPLPTGASNPAQSVTTTYTWNPDRTPDTETVQPGVPNQQRVTGYAYPSLGANYGLPSSITVNASGDPNGARITGTTYSADGYFPRTVTNPLLQTVTTTTRPEDGQPSQAIDANGLRINTQYDAFGFATRVQYRGRTDSDYLAPDKLMSLTWCSGCFAQGRTRVTVVQDGSPTQFKDLDQFGRTVGTAQRLQDGSWSYTAAQYNARGQVAAQSQPYRSGDTVYWTRFLAYDVIGRLLHKSVPQNNHDGRGDLVTTYTYSGRQTAIKVCGSLDADESRCLNLSRTTDSLGRYVETIDAAGSPTRFWYDGSGNAIAIRDAKGSVITAAYNAIGQRTSVNDPNQGQWSFTYDALGEVLTQTDAKAIVTSFAYDALGRLKQRSASYDYDGAAGAEAIVDSWSFDPANAIGQEGSHERTLNGARLRRVATTYDTLSRPVSASHEQVGSSGVFTQRTAYDAYYGRPKARDFGNGESLWLQYSAYGDLVRETDATSGTDYRVVIAVDAAGQPTRETYAGGNLTATRTYSARTGQLQGILYGSLANANLRRLDYRYDVFGNLAQQALDTGQSVEDYTYDTLQRLTRASRSGAVSGTVDYGYDAIGNLTRKTDFSADVAGAYSYSGGSCGGGPNAVKSVALPAGGSRSYCYDANGNLTGDSAGLVLRYDHTQRPLQITRGGVTSTFDYDVDGTRFRQVGSDTVQYFPGLERRTGKDTTYAGSVAVVTTASGTRRVDYQLTDRLGSVDAIADSTGTLLETRGYDAFGKPRTGTWGDATRLASTTTTPHGFTGHEHLNQLELIHMNGRVYDYALGRFTGVDPVIQFPLNSQSLNPYSYILNNPLSGTDPTGYATCNMTDNKECLEDGVNTVVDGKGNKSTVIVGQKGDNIAVTGSISANNFKYISSDINMALNPANGADAWVKNGPNGSQNIGSDRGKGCSGGGPIQCYSVTSRGKDSEVVSFERTFEASGSYGAINGIMNNIGRALGLMADHVRDRYGANEFLLAHNPTEGFIRDSIETGRDKLGWTTAVAKQFADIQAGVDHPMSWVAHSQGGAIFSEATRYNIKRGVVSLGNLRVAFDSGANNRWVTNGYLLRTGIGLHGQGYYDAPNDFVPQVLGLRGLNRPWNMARSVWSLPSLFGPNSPHTNAIQPEH